ncbi:LEA type 2 family protein [Streptomyces spinosirectus]|jgi:hypothetical protein|uniref:LEA type 2 family protein n=1 Tax=Streptomyces TaxID=1883 RepID=UPI000FFE3CF1|nr:MULTISPECIES: LEA type 2 family protein [Streptomyces]MBY8343479.1 LEA type 2 family protein [Streptomyces plumbidurans]UIR19781.1 LEA type 2 family protein [Streptomyces spinosirectus]
MHSRGRSLKFTAVLGFVVLSLTGFTGHSHHSRSHGHYGDSGGGCSSSSQDHDSSSYSSHNRYYDDDDYDDSYGGSGSGGTSVSTSSSPSGHEDGTARLVSCATVKHPYATVEITNPNAVKSGFDVHITFEDADNMTVNGTIKEFTVPANGTKTVRIPVDNAEEAAPQVDHCDLDPVASYHW